MTTSPSRQFLDWHRCPACWRLIRWQEGWCWGCGIIRVQRNRRKAREKKRRVRLDSIAEPTRIRAAYAK